MNYTYQELIKHLRTTRYREGAEVLVPGDFVVNGETVIVWPVNGMVKIRLSFFGDQIERVQESAFDSSSNILTNWKTIADCPEIWPNQVKVEQGVINPLDYLVHPHHGIGQFEQVITRIDATGEAKTYAQIKYAGNDKLYFPHDRWFDLMPYYGSKNPRLTRLYSKSWQKTKEKVQRDLIGIARGLLKIFLQRQETTREPIQYSEEYAVEIEKLINFQLTEDQEKAWTNIKEDLCKKDQPMDRLICGDVGFGKTELAIRASAQMAANGKQVVLLAPTTVLAEQHYTLFSKRFAHLPVNVAHLSRLNQSQEKEVLASLKNGTIDIIIGTHRLLGKDVETKDLGLLIVDEEQKFGVDHKERIKKMRPSIDVLSLSATPIPRTLYMALSSLRGLDILRTPPQGRKKIETNIVPYSDALLVNAIKQEVDRGGQVYLVHNKVMSIGLVYQRVSKIMEEAGFSHLTMAVAHGQMGDVTLADVMSRFLAGQVQVLIASTIVENGLDCPGANTLVVLNSERFGLSDLYQLRGRVGRRKLQAHAYFVVGGIFDTETEMVLTETAQKRLSVLEDTAELGSGWSVALRDLEIRGGGNILGHEQHGNMESIGLLLYSQLLQEEVGKQAKKLHIKLPFQ